MTRREFDGVTIECTQGDIAAQSDLDAVVNAANAELRTGGGVAGALHRAAGPGLEEECRPLAPITPGQAVITGAHRLPNRYVVHCLGPVHGVDEPAEQLLANCYREALQLADGHGVASIGFPSISTGAFGYPVEAAAQTAMDAVAGALSGLGRIRLVRFVLFGRGDFQVYAGALERLPANGSVSP